MARNPVSFLDFKSQDKSRISNLESKIQNPKSNDSIEIDVVSVPRGRNHDGIF
jgi:hypothetical protein